MRRIDLTWIVLTTLLSGCTHMNSNVSIARIEPSAEQWNELVSFVKQVISQPSRSCVNSELDTSGATACESHVALVDRVEIEPVVGGPRLDVVVAIKPAYCVSPIDLIRSLPEEWAFEFTPGSGGASDSSEIVLNEIYESPTLNERLVLDIDPSASSLCLRTLRVIHWGG